MQTNVLQGMRAMLQRLHQQRRETQMIKDALAVLAFFACLACLALI